MLGSSYDDRRSIVLITFHVRRDKIHTTELTKLVILLYQNILYHIILVMRVDNFSQSASLTTKLHF